MSSRCAGDFILDLKKYEIKKYKSLLDGRKFI